jgi:hypothetical protein
MLDAWCLVRALRIDSVSWVASKFLDRWSKLGRVPVVPGLGTLDAFRLCVLERHGLLASECVSGDQSGGQGVQESLYQRGIAGIAGMTTKSSR